MSLISRMLRWVRTGGWLFLLSLAPCAESSGPIGAWRTFALTPPIQGQSSQPEENARLKAYLRFIEGRQLRASGKLKEAIEAYQEVIRLDPLAAEPHVELGEIYFFHLSRREEAEAAAERAVRLAPQSLSAHLLLARLYLFDVYRGRNPEAAKIERAISAYEAVTQLDAHSAEAWAFLAELYQARNETARQIEALEKWLSAPPSTEPQFYRALTGNDLSPDQAFYQLSQAYWRQGKAPKAIEMARRACELEPESNLYARHLLSLLRAATTIEEELTTLEQLLKTVTSPTLQIGYGAALLRAGRYQEAVAALRAYLKQDPTNINALGLLAAAERRSNQRLAAVETLKEAIASSEANVRLRLMLDLAETYEELGYSDLSIAQYEEILEALLNKKRPQQSAELAANVVSRLVRSYRRDGYQQKIQPLLQRAQQLLGDNNPLFESLKIESLREQGERLKALEVARAAALRWPQEQSFKLTAAIVLGEMQRYQESIDLLRSLLKGMAEGAAADAYVYLVLSSIQMQGGQLQEAEASIRKALQLNPNDSNLLIQLSFVQDRAGQYQASEQTLRRLIEREPDNATALNNLGYFLLERGERLDEARALIERAVSIEPTNGSFLDSLGWAHYKLGRLEEARKYLEKAIRYERHNPTIYEHLGDVLRDLGRLQEARQLWEKALEFSVGTDETARLKDKLKKN